MKKYCWPLFVAISALFVSSVHGQGTFQNLDFESANLPEVPSGQFGTLQPISMALPSWSAYIGTNQITQIQHNNFFIGTANVSVLGPDWTFHRIIEGDYTLLLQPGSTGQALVDASIGQSGFIPLGVQSLRFTSDSATHFFDITIDNQNVPLFRLSETPFFAFYGADISAFAGSTSELKITARYNPLGGGFYFLDSIQFSNQPIPEPGTGGLLALGALLLGWRIFNKQS